MATSIVIKPPQNQKKTKTKKNVKANQYVKRQKSTYQGKTVERQWHGAQTRKELN